MADELDDIRELARSGRPRALRRAVLRRLPPNSCQSRDAVELALILHVVAEWQRDTARKLLADYSSFLRTRTSDIEWLRSLAIRAEIIAEYEGYGTAVTWLGDLLPSVTPPDDGVVHLALGSLMLRRGGLLNAANELSRAARRSLHGLHWYWSDALQAMAICQLRLGNHALSFEYCKAYLVTLYVDGRLHAQELLNRLVEFANTYSQFDYLADIYINLARYKREEGELFVAAVCECAAAANLEALGSYRESASCLQRGAADADQAGTDADGVLGSSFRTLAYYVAPSLPDRDEVRSLCDELSERISTPSRKQLLLDTQTWLLSARSLPPELVQRWRRAALTYRDRVRAGGRLLGEEALSIVHMCALLCRLAWDLGDEEGALELATALEEVNDHSSFVFASVCKMSVKRLFALGRHEAASSMCTAALGIVQHTGTRAQLLLHRAKALIALGREAGICPDFRGKGRMA